MIEEKENAQNNERFMSIHLALNIIILLYTNQGHQLTNESYFAFAYISFSINAEKMNSMQNIFCGQWCGRNKLAKSRDTIFGLETNSTQMYLHKYLYKVYLGRV